MFIKNLFLKRFPILWQPHKFRFVISIVNHTVTTLFKRSSERITHELNRVNVFIIYITINTVILIPVNLSITDIHKSSSLTCLILVITNIVLIPVVLNSCCKNLTYFNIFLCCRYNLSRFSYSVNRGKYITGYETNVVSIRKKLIRRKLSSYSPPEITVVGTVQKPHLLVYLLIVPPAIIVLILKIR